MWLGEMRSVHFPCFYFSAESAAPWRHVLQCKHWQEISGAGARSLGPFQRGSHKC